MKFKSLMPVLGICLAFCASAQDEPNKTRNHYVGLQTNQLLRQFIDLGNAPSPNNPYLITYSSNDEYTGRGFSMGLNVSLDNFKDDDLTLTSRDVGIQYRFGWDRKRALGEKWLLATGFDLLTGFSWDKTETEFTTTSTTTLTNQSVDLGLGPRAELGFFIAKHILISTETNLYFRARFGNAKEEIPGNAVEKNSINSQTLSLVLPQVLYLTYVF